MKDKKTDKLPVPVEVHKRLRKVRGMSELYYPAIPDKPFDLYERLKEASKRFKEKDGKKEIINNAK